MLPEVEAYYEAIDVAQREFRASTWHYHDGETKLNEQCEQARQKLAESNNPLVAWIANHEVILRSYRDEACVILRALPTTMRDLQQIAERNQFCRTWSRFKTEALSAGIMLEEIQLEYKAGNANWRTFDGYVTTNGSSISHAEVAPLFGKGITFLQFDDGSYPIKIQERL